MGKSVKLYFQYAAYQKVFKAVQADVHSFDIVRAVRHYKQIHG